MSQRELTQALNAIVKFFENQGAAAGLPFVGMFPANSCEVVSALAGEALRRRYGKREVWVVEGTNRQTSEKHFWIEVDGIVLDATAHQFDGCSSPVLLTAPSPLEVKFSSTNRHQPPIACAGLSSLGIDEDAQNRLVVELGKEIDVAAGGRSEEAAKDQHSR